MTQATINEQMFVLSPYTSVRVSEFGQIEFTITPENEQMQKTVVNFSGPAWMSFCSKARGRINRCVEEDEEDNFLFHPNTKFAGVSKKYQYPQIFFQTYTKRGHVMKDHNLFLTLDEWKQLDGQVEEINKKLEEVHIKKKSRYRPQLTMYQFQLSKDLPHTTSDMWYFSRDHAEERGEEHMELTDRDDEDMTIQTILQPPPDPLKFMTVVYCYLVARAALLINSYMCPGCGDGKYMKGGSHTGSYGCRFPDRNPVKDYLIQIKKCVTDDVVLDLFYDCWRYLKLPHVEAASLLNSIHTLVNDNTLIDRANRYNGDVELGEDDPVCMLIDDVLDFKKFRIRVFVQMRGGEGKKNKIQVEEEEEVEVEEVQPSTSAGNKKLKLSDIEEDDDDDD